MGNSPLASYTRISPNRTTPRNHKIDTITIHCVVGQLSVESMGSIFFNPKAKSSCNYGIGSDGRIGLYVDEEDRSWCTSSPPNDNRAITIEVACDPQSPYAVKPIVMDSLISLLVDICIRNDIPRLKWLADKSLIGNTEKQNMTVHRWFANKSCPGDYLYNKHFWIAETVNDEIEEVTMPFTQADWDTMYDNRMNRIAAMPGSSWSEDVREWAIKLGFINGDGNGNYRWKSNITREEMCQVFYNVLVKGEK